MNKPENDFVWKFTILGKPVSQKNAKRVGMAKGRAYIYTPAGVKKWHKEAAVQLADQWESGDCPEIPPKTPMEVRIISYLAKGQSIDVDNLASAPMDAVQKAGIYQNDYWVRCLISSRKRDWENPRVEIEIRKCNGD
jgi:Holliday junction resolvase RusA-like endonuclease|tara:strand:- start:2025 stop:2435 length:411 start_codon:yes stop_codon:yes gene_type:complete